MNIPTFINVQFTDKDGNLTPAMQYYNDQLNQALLNGVGQNGFTISQLTTAQISTLGGDAAIPVGATFFDTDAAKLKVKTAAGVVETITSA
jgi:hypothetical protein